MGDLRLYRDILCLTENRMLGTSTTEYITPYSLSAYTSGSTGIIETLTPVEESTGKYYVSLELDDYVINTVYTLVWPIIYVENTTTKILSTRFRVNYSTTIIGSEIEIDTVKSNPFESAFTMKRNDTLPVLIAKIKTRGCMNEVLPLTLTGVSSVNFSMEDECGNLTISSQTAEIVDSTNGVIQYSWQDGDTIDSGKYKGEFEITFSGGTKMTVPKIGGINIQINKDINEI